MRASRVVPAGAVAACALLAPAVATAAEKPAATTGGAANLAPTSARGERHGEPARRGDDVLLPVRDDALLRRPDAHRSRRAPAPRGGGSPRASPASPRPRRTTTASWPATRWASPAGPTARSRRRRQPLGVSLAATPNPLFPGRATTLAGVLSGTGNANRQVVLQSNPFPYTQGFVNASDPHVTDAQGGFSFPVLSVPVNTQFRVLMPANPNVVSPIVVAEAAVHTGVHTRTSRGSRSGVIRFAGFVRPAVDGSAVLVQKLRGGVWVTIAKTFARSVRGNRSRYVKRVRQRRGGRYRVLAYVTGAYSPGASRTVTAACGTDQIRQGGRRRRRRSARRRPRART